VKRQVTFGKWQDVSENKPPVVVLRFPFTVRRIRKGALPQVPSHHYVDVKISDIRMVEWGFGSESEALDNLSFVKTLFAFALDEVTPKLRSRDIRESYSKVLHTGNSPEKNPYDPAKVPDPERLSFHIEQ
jgi:hypothetical protein